jgi:hypothetical protein
MSDKKSFFSGIASKLSVLMGGAVLVTGGVALATQTPMISVTAEAQSVPADGARKPLPAKLTLKQQIGGFRLIAQHASHSSHSSHGSHASHASHASQSS